MSTNRTQRPRARQQLQTGTLMTADPASVSRHLSDLATAQQATEKRIAGRNQVTVTLPVGATRINHGLGRKALGCNVTPTVADATWAWAMTAADDKQVTITTVGIAQPNARVEIY